MHKSLKRETIGNKAYSLILLKKYNCNVPLTYVISSEAFSDFLKDKEVVLRRIFSELMTLPDLNFAVRSSTNIEDGSTYSHAGQFETILNVKGAPSIYEAIRQIWESVLGKDHNEYNEKDIGFSVINCAVILQEMIPAKLAGVGFSKNPVNNANEIIIEAVEGNGEKLVQKGVTPMRWIFRNAMLKDGPADFAMQHLIIEVFQTIARIYKINKRHIDVEWVTDGDNVYFLQLRAVTANTEQVVYSSRMAQEMLPGQIKPLVWSVNIPLVNGVWLDILSRLIKKTDLQPFDLAKAFYYRCYFNVTNLGKIFAEFGVPFERLEEIMISNEKTRHTFKPGLKTIKHSFRIISFIWSVFQFEKIFLTQYPFLIQKISELDRDISSDIQVDNFADLFLRLMRETKKLAYFNILTPLLMRIYNKRFTVKIRKLGIDYHQIDFSVAFPELETYSPVFILGQIKEQINSVMEKNHLTVLRANELSIFDAEGNIQKEIDTFLMQFGHFSESGNDFSYPKWEEDLDFVLKMAMETESLKKENMLNFNQINFSPIQRRSIIRAFNKAGRFKVYREQISSLYIHGYGLFRKLYLKLADEWVKNGILKDREDIFYLYHEEIDAVLNAEGTGRISKLVTLVQQRKAEMMASQNLILPMVIYGETAPEVEFGNIKNLKGVATSPGLFKGRLKIVKKASDFHKVKRGDVLAIPFSDVSWTPVLVKAGAILSESGGILSHCSIIAREMGIPALVSVENVCALPDDLLVTVNASNGILTVHEYE